jgi:hypothetical protein
MDYIKKDPALFKYKTRIYRDTGYTMLQLLLRFHIPSNVTLINYASKWKARNGRQLWGQELLQVLEQVYGKRTGISNATLVGKIRKLQRAALIPPALPVSKTASPRQNTHNHHSSKGTMVAIRWRTVKWNVACNGLADKGGALALRKVYTLSMYAKVYQLCEVASL